MPRKAVYAIASVLLGVLLTDACDFVEEVWTSIGGDLDVEMLGQLRDPALPEPSGIEKSVRYPGVYWTHNDSENPPEIFAIDTNGNVLAIFEVMGAENRDWEDIAADDSGNLYIADTGDNERERREVVIYQIPEPNPRSQSRKVSVRKAFVLRYPGGRRYDCEALCYNAGWLYLFTKSRSFTDSTVCFGFEPGKTSGDTTELELIGIRGDVNLVTAADYNPHRRKLAILTYTHLIVLDGAVRKFGSNQKLLMSRVPFVAGEAVCWSGKNLIALTEQGGMYNISHYRL